MPTLDDPRLIAALAAGAAKGTEVPTIAQVLAAGANAGSVGITNLGETTLVQSAEGNEALKITSAYEAADAADIFTVRLSNADTVFRVDSAGDAFFDIRHDEGVIQVQAQATHTESFLYVVRSDLGNVFRVDPVGNPVLIGNHAAPADASLAAGECALWFDQTNGASKLMVKGKSADGTVVSGTIPLA